MELQIISTVVASFLFFLALAAILFRLTRPEAAITWMVRVFVCIGVLVMCFRFGSWSLAEYVWWGVLYGLLVAIFVFGPFSIMEASVTLGIFTHIARTKGGITRSELLRRYNTRAISRKRIARLLYSRELLYSRGKYMLGRTSYFRLREIVLDIFRLAFVRS